MKSYSQCSNFSFNLRYTSEKVKRKSKILLLTAVILGSLLILEKPILKVEDQVRDKLTESIGLNDVKVYLVHEDVDLQNCKNSDYLYITTSKGYHRMVTKIYPRNLFSSIRSAILNKKKKLGFFLQKDCKIQNSTLSQVSSF